MQQVKKLFAVLLPFMMAAGLFCSTVPAAEISDSDQAAAVEIIGEGAVSDVAGESTLLEAEPSVLVNLGLEGACSYTAAFNELQLMNAEREAAGLPALRMDADLMTAAMLRAAESHVYFSHTRPDGTEWSTCFPDGHTHRGENIAYGYKTAETVTKGWLNSPEHKENILRDTYTCVGIGCFEVNGVRCWAQLFGDAAGEGDCEQPVDEIVSQGIWICTRPFTGLHPDVSDPPTDITLNVYMGPDNNVYAQGETLEKALKLDTSYWNISQKKFVSLKTITFDPSFYTVSADNSDVVTGLDTSTLTMSAPGTCTLSILDTYGNLVQEKVIRVYLRVAGKDRYGTAGEIEARLQAAAGGERPECIVVASGTGYPDALSGSYLACAKNAPIMLVGKNNEAAVAEQVKESLRPGGLVYLLGGNLAVSEAFEDSLVAAGCNVSRLQGKDRYGTNLAVLQEVGVEGKSLLVCSGKGFADCLSASAVGQPILLVGDKMNDAQKTYVSENKPSAVYVIGGGSAVSDSVMFDVSAVSGISAWRVYGANRYETSVSVADRFFGTDAEAVVLTRGMSYPDGLCGGPLAYQAKGPLLLVDSNAYKAAAAYIDKLNYTHSYVLGGDLAVTDATVKNTLR